MIKKTVLPIIIILFLLTGCSGVKQDGLSTPNSTGVNTQTVVDQNIIRPEIKASIDKLKDFYNVIDLNHMTIGKRDLRMFEPKSPKEFEAGMYRVVFQTQAELKNYDLFKDVPQRAEKIEPIEYITLFFQTEDEVGHLNKVISGTTVVGGYVFIYLGNLDSSNQIEEKMKLTKVEQKYLVEQLYRGFAKKMTYMEAEYLNNTKDYALAIYFNGAKGIDELHSEQIKKA